ncbi:nucleoside monophosphate kinase [Candidatus Collierbacteria bacterium]|nr:nucleoside monophosphate kinase [Candidatus Collierbacteria bacterium]
MNLIILGAPGSGKGTQADLLAEKFGLTHLSSGQLLRKEAETGSPKGKLIADLLIGGKLLPFETVLEVLEPALKATTSGFILDGTPRNLHQSEYLDYFFKENKITLNKVIYLDIPIEEGIKRIMKRGQIEHRSDDNYDSVKIRMKAYQVETMPVIDYFEKKGLLIKIDGTPDIQTIFQDIVSQLTIA